MQSQTTYLGFSVSSRGVKSIPAITAPIMKFPQPEGKKAVRQFLGIGGYDRRFIQNHARRAEPLQKLIAQDVDFVWGSEQQNAFQDIKTALGQATLKRHPGPTRKFIIDCDASILGLGAALHERENLRKE